jgi:rSAM/selenodomain-associated transferase 1
MARRPVPGEVKTRLTPRLRPQQAAALYQAFLEDVLEESARLPGVARYCFVHPSPGDPPALPGASHGYHLEAQQGVDLAQRMVHAFDTLFRRGHQPVVMRNSDSPTLPWSYLERALAAFHDPSVDLMLGPDLGGGYYLVGLRRPAPDLFLRVAMSTPGMLERTQAVARASGLSFALLPPWPDVDTPQDLERLETELMEPRIAAVCPRTSRWLECFRGEPPIERSPR